MDHLMQAIDSAILIKDYTTLYQIFSNSDSAGDITWQSIGQGEQRSLAAHFIQKITSNSNDNNHFLPAAFGIPSMMNVMTKVLGHLPVTVDNAADNTLRQQMFDYLINDGEDYIGAARILSGMRMDDDPSSIYYMSAADRTDVYVRQAECFLAQDEIAESDACVQKAGSIVESITQKENHTSLLLRYKSTYARVLDANRKFLSAAQRYHELSQSSYANLIDDDDLLQMLGRAATCAILAQSGPQRMRVLGHICSDERLSLLDSVSNFATHSSIIKKMHSHQIIKIHEMKQFELSLAEHQKAKMGDGLSIMERGVVEHNMIAVSKLYKSIYFKELSMILGVVNIQKTETIAANMIMEGFIHGIIDQVNGLLIFNTEESPEEAWDRSITSFCLELNKVTDGIKAAGSM